MRIMVFHYHLLPGGVTDVIIHSVRAVIQHVPDVQEVRLVTGRPENTATVLACIAGTAGPSEDHEAPPAATLNDVPVAVDIFPELGYTDPRESDSEAADRARTLERGLLERYGSDEALWWVHNYHLGKNPSFTRALCAIATLPGAPRMLLHVHDFPECARYENLAYLNRVAGPSPYPAGPEVRYAVINERDRQALREAGIPDARVGLLLNPLPLEEALNSDAPGVGGSLSDRERVVARLADFAADQGYRFHPDGPLLLYPIRAIRRKNVLEIASIARLVPDANLIVTLPGVSEPEQPYSQLVDYAYDDRRVHGVFGIGLREDEYALSFEQIAAAADLVVSSSVQEGFGLLFVNALRWRRPLLARRLDVLAGIDSLFSGYPAHLYDAFSVPTRSPSVSSMQAYLRMRYQERLAELDRVLPARAKVQLTQDVDGLLTGESIDLSFLPAQMQLTLLGDLRERGFGALVRALNADTISAVERLQAAEAPDSTENLTRLLGYGSFARSFTALVGEAGSAGAGQERYEGVQDALVERFARMEQLRLILGPMDAAPH